MKLASRQIIMDAESALESWTLEVAAIKPTLSFHQTVDDVYIDDEEEAAAAEEEWAGEHEGGEEEDQIVEPTEK